MTPESIKAKRREEVRARAEECFKDHVLTQETPDRWLCKKPGSGYYAFRVTNFHDGLILSGDIDELVVVVYNKDPISWLRRGVLSDPEYVLNKIPLAFRRKEVIDGLVLHYLDEDEDGLAKKIREILTGSDEDEDEWDVPSDLTHDQWVEAYYGAGGEESVPDIEDWDWRTLFQCEALKWFCRALDKAESAALQTGEQQSGR